MTHRASSFLRRPLVTLLLGTAGLLPAALTTWHAASAQEGAESAWQARQRVLRQLPSDESVLINVTQREMPASPDILNLGRRSTRALQRCLADNVDAALRATCASLLGSVGDKAALPTLHTALEDWDAGVRHAVIAALGRIPHVSSFEPLLRLFQRADEEPANRELVLDTFGRLGHVKAVQALRAELRRKDSSFAWTAWQALWRSRHLMAASTLEQDLAFALASGNDALVLAATEAAAEVRSTALSRQLIPLVEHPNVEIRNKAVYALGKIGDPTATRALLARLPQVREARMLNNIAFALERLDPKAFYPAAKQLIEHKQAVIRLNAAYVLGDVRRPEGRPWLEAALADPNDFVKTSAVVALGKLGAPESERALLPFVDSPNPTLREQAIYSLHELSGGKRGDLVYDRLFPSRDEETRRRAALTLAKQQDPRVRDYVLWCFLFNQCSSEQVGGYLLKDGSPEVVDALLTSFARGLGTTAPLLATLRPPGLRPVAQGLLELGLQRQDAFEIRDALAVLGAVGDRDTAARLAPKAAQRQLLDRLRFNVALSRLGDTAADARLLQDLELAPDDWLPQVVERLALIAEPAARQRLRGELERRTKSDNLALAMAAAAILLRWDPDAGVHRFLAALGAPSVQERDLATRYLARDRRVELTWLLRRALAREGRPSTRDRLRSIVEQRG